MFINEEEGQLETSRFFLILAWFLP